MGSLIKNCELSIRNKDRVINELTAINSKLKVDLEARVEQGTEERRYMEQMIKARKMSTGSGRFSVTKSFSGDDEVKEPKELEFISNECIGIKDLEENDSYVGEWSASKQLSQDTSGEPYLTVGYSYQSTKPKDELAS